MSVPVLHRRRVRALAGSLLLLLASAGCGGRAPAAWTTVPSVSVVGAPDDPRVAVTAQAVAFRNTSLTALGSPFQLGPIRYHTASVPVDAVVQPTTTADHLPQTVQELPQAAQDLPGDIVVVLTNADLISFTTLSSIDDNVIIFMRGLQYAPWAVRMWHAI